MEESLNIMVHKQNGNMRKALLPTQVVPRSLVLVLLLSTPLQAIAGDGAGCPIQLPTTTTSVFTMENPLMQRTSTQLNPHHYHHASWGAIPHTRRNIPTACALFVRGGGSDSTKSWSAGSTINKPSSPWQSQKGEARRTRYPVVEDLDDYYYSSTQQSERARTKDVIDAFLTRDSRNSFIARVYAILTGQLFATAISIFLFGMNPELSSWMANKGRVVPLMSLGLSTIAWFIICSSTRARREAPMKWQLLSLFTLGEAISVGFISSIYELRSVFNAMIATAVATLSVTFYTLLQKNPKYDLSQWGAGLASCGVIFLVYGLLHVLEIFGVLPAGFLPYTETMYSLVGSVLFSFYLAHHTRMIVSGKHTKYQMNEKDYVFGAMSLYNDVINMFIYLLRLLGEDRVDNNRRD